MKKYARIKEIGKVITGKTPSTENEDNFGGDFPFITPSDISTFDEKYIAETERTISSKGYKKLKNNLLPMNSVCFVCIGSTIGKMCLTNKPSFTNQQINALLVNENYDSQYVFYLLRYVKGYFQQIGAGTGSGKGIVNKSTFEKSRICVEKDLFFQKKIATMLSAYDELIENNNKRIKLLEQMAENLYKEWFVRFRFPGHETAEFENGIPKGWEILRMENFCYVTDGTHDTPKETNLGVPLVTGRCIRNGFVDYDEAYLISEDDHNKIKKRSGLKSGDILFSNIGTVGNTCLVDYEREFSVKNVIIFKPPIRAISTYLYYWLISPSMQAIFSTQTNGASQQFVGLTFMRRIKILVPNKYIMTSFEKNVAPIIDAMMMIHKENQNLIKQRDLLLPRLMSGKLEV